MNQHNRENQPLYSLRVIDYSLPSIVSADKVYYGTEQMILDFLEREATYTDANEHNLEKLNAAKEYFSGQGPGRVSLFGEEPEPMIEPVSYIGEAKYQRKNMKYMFYNIYRYGTEHCIEEIKARLIYIRDRSGKYKRCIQANLKNVSYNIGFGKRTYNKSLRCWGLPGFIKINDTVLTNTLYFSDTVFKSKEVAKRDMIHPHKPYLRNFFFEIFGDG